MPIFWLKKKFMAKNKNSPLVLFHSAVRAVPAYRRFLKDNRINPVRIKTLDDFQRLVPLVEKENYLRRYPYTELFPAGCVPPMFSASSGSSGEPFYWPRGDEQEEQGGIIHWKIFKDIFGINKEKTLLIIGFAMGNWIGGTFTVASGRYVAKKNPNFSLIPPGIEKEEILSILKNLAPRFERVILSGYPPFVMDVLTEARTRKISLPRKFNLLMAGEAVSEVWRDEAHRLAGIKDSYRGSATIYGTADAAALGHETPLSIFIRREAQRNPRLARAVYGEEVSFIPSTVQYDPRRIFFETVDGHIVFTVKAGIPLIRYNIKDFGKIIAYAEMMKILRRFGLEKNAKRLKLDGWRLPFICLFGRKDVAISFYGLNIYPENIKAGLEEKTTRKFFTGKFTIRKNEHEKGRRHELVLTLEMKPKIRPSARLAVLAKKTIVKNLLRLNSEYRKLHSLMGERIAEPLIELAPAGDTRFAITKAKHWWFKKS